MWQQLQELSQHGQLPYLHFIGLQEGPLRCNVGQPLCIFDRAAVADRLHQDVRCIADIAGTQQRATLPQDRLASFRAVERVLLAETNDTIVLRQRDFVGIESHGLVPGANREIDSFVDMAKRCCLEIMVGNLRQALLPRFGMEAGQRIAGQAVQAQTVGRRYFVVQCFPNQRMRESSTITDCVVFNKPRGGSAIEPGQHRFDVHGRDLYQRLFFKVPAEHRCDSQQVIDGR